MPPAPQEVRDQNLRTAVCWNCNKPGHHKNDCPSPAKPAPQTSKQEKPPRKKKDWGVPDATAKAHECTYCHKMFPSGRRLFDHLEEHGIFGNKSVVTEKMVLHSFLPSFLPS
jgi:hypothetical protein